MRSFLDKFLQIYAQNHSDPTPDCTSTFWSPILDWRQQAAYEEKEGRLWSSNWSWGGRQNGMFCQWSSGHRVHFELNMSCSGGADRDLQTGCRSRKRRRRSIRCVMLGPTVCTLTHDDRRTGTRPLLPEPDCSPLFHLLLNKVSCVRGHPAHADWRGLRRSQHLTTQLQDTTLKLTCVCVCACDLLFSHLFTWFQSVSEDRKWVIRRGPDIQAVLSLRLPNANLSHTRLR